LSHLTPSTKACAQIHDCAYVHKLVFSSPLKCHSKYFFALTKKIVFVQTKTLSAEMMISQEPIKAGSSEEKNAS
jgi:hypothetical protein